MPNYMVSQHENKVVLRNYEGRIVAYEEPQEYTGMCMEDQPCRYCRQALKEDTGPGGVAGLFDDDPGNIALIPREEEPRKVDDGSPAPGDPAGAGDEQAERVVPANRSTP
jgi:lysine 2,3-aminomutase